MSTGNGGLFESPFFATLGDVFFFGSPGGNGPVHGDCEHQDEACKPIRSFDLALRNAKASRFEVGEHGFDSPAHAIVENLVLSWAYVHGYDPWLFVSVFMEHTDVGDDPCSIEFRLCKSLT